jgi:hypothetical protein
MFVETIRSKKGNKQYVSTLVRETYRDRGKVKHRTLANISKLPITQIEQIKAIISGK